MLHIARRDRGGQACFAALTGFSGRLVADAQLGSGLFEGEVLQSAPPDQLSLQRRQHAFGDRVEQDQIRMSPRRRWRLGLQPSLSDCCETWDERVLLIRSRAR